jgi:hypothetical protein
MINYMDFLFFCFNDLEVKAWLAAFFMILIHIAYDETINSIKMKPSRNLDDTYKGV